MDKPLDHMPQNKTVEWQDIRVTIIVRLRRVEGKPAVIDSIRVKESEEAARWWA